MVRAQQRLRDPNQPGLNAFMKRKQSFEVRPVVSTYEEVQDFLELRLDYLMLSFEEVRWRVPLVVDLVRALLELVVNFSSRVHSSPSSAVELVRAIIEVPRLRHPPRRE